MTPRTVLGAAAFAAVSLVCLTPVSAQDFERYRPKTIPIAPAPRTVTKGELPAVEGSDRVLVESLDAVIVLDNKDKIDPDNANEDAAGISYDFDAPGSLVRSSGFRRIVNGYIGRPITLRNLNQMSRDLIVYYRKCGQPVVDVVIPEQRITAGSVQIVVIESRIGKVLVQDGCYFDACDLTKWVQCTRRGSRIYESRIANDLFWLNQNSFRRVDVDLRPGSAEGTTDVIFEVNDVRPINAYAGYEDTGVRTLMLERLIAGAIWGNAFGRGATASYQYTADADFRSLHAHALSYLEPLNRCWSFQTYASWARVDPIVNFGVDQSGESWQAGVGMFRHLVKNRRQDTALSFGFDFKRTNNNLEFGGITVQNSNADLAQLRVGLQSIHRYDCDEYAIYGLDTFIGPGAGFSSGANAESFNTIRANTTPDYFYARGRLERLWSLPKRFQLLGRGRAQLATERLLFSETLGFGGFDSIRGYDQRTWFGDHGWLLSAEIGPKTRERCFHGVRHRFRWYGFYDAGKAFTDDAIPGEPSNEFLHSIGCGLRWSVGQRANLRLDYGYGLEDGLFFQEGGRIHVGFIALFGPRP